MPVRTDGPAPYAPLATVLEVITRYRDRGLQTPFTNDVLLRAGVPESLSARTLQALRLLDLITEEGQPTEQFELLKRAPSSEYQGALADLVRAAYAEVFQFANPATDDIETVTDAFRTFTPSGQRGRMVTLFLGLCEAAGIVDETPKRTRAPRPATRAPRNSDLSPRQTGRGGRAAPRKETPPPALDVPGVRPEISGLLAALPDPKVGWTKDRRDQFLQTFSAVVDFVIPIRDHETVVIEEEEEE